MRLKDVLEGNRVLVTLHFDEEKVAELGDPLLVERLSVGDHLLYDPRSGYVVEKLPRSEAEELVLEEVPDVDYEHIGGLQHELEQVRDAIRSRGFSNLVTPRAVKLLHEIPRLGSGKVNHRELEKIV